MHFRVLACACLLTGALPAAADVCTVSVVGPSFGVYDTTSKSPNDAVGRVQISCLSGATVTVSTGGSATYFPRAMRSGAATLAYNLFVDAARTRILGTWGGGTQVIFVPQGNNRSVPIFGRIPPLQDVDPGTYTDTLTVSVFF
jgi:spore coat protein U-like protein